jgi:hypothetical protein
MNHQITSISDLPTDPLGGGGSNISLNAFEKQPPQQMQSSQQMSSPQQQPNNISLDQTTISQIVNGLQQATISGATQLSSRDISMETVSHNVDQMVQPNYIPPPPLNKEENNYIQNEEDINNIINNFSSSVQRENMLDRFYNELQTPLLLMVLYFLFQLPFFKSLLFKYIPFLFLNDGNYNIKGLLFISFLFSLVFYNIHLILALLKI